jgi:hypothetical protein
MYNSISNINHKCIIWAYLHISMYEIIFGLLGFVVTVAFILIAEMYLHRKRKKRQNI